MVGKSRKCINNNRSYSEFINCQTYYRIYPFHVKLKNRTKQGFQQNRKESKVQKPWHYL
jgi:hypothetical protein